MIYSACVQNLTTPASAFLEISLDPQILNWVIRDPDHAPFRGDLSSPRLSSPFCYILFHALAIFKGRSPLNSAGSAPTSFLAAPLRNKMTSFDFISGNNNKIREVTKFFFSNRLSVSGYHITSHHMVKTDAGLNGLYIREITIYIRLYY